MCLRTFAAELKVTFISRRLHRVSDARRFCGHVTPVASIATRPSPRASRVVLYRDSPLDLEPGHRDELISES